MILGKEGQGPARGFKGTPGFRERASEATRRAFHGPHKTVSRDAHREKALSPEEEAIVRHIDRIAKGEDYARGE